MNIVRPDGFEPSTPALLCRPQCNEGQDIIFIGGADSVHKKPALIFAPLAQSGLIRASIFLSLCAQMDLNHRPLPYKGSALTTELWAHKCE